MSPCSRTMNSMFFASTHAHFIKNIKTIVSRIGQPWNLPLLHEQCTFDNSFTIVCYIDMKIRLLTMCFSCSMILEVIYIIMSETKRINIYSIWSRAKLTTKWWDANFVSCVEIVTWFIFSKILKWDSRRYFQTTIRKFTS